MRIVCKIFMFNFLRKKRIESTIFQKREFVVLDTELTGLNEKEDHIISIGAILMKERRISLGDIFYRILNPQGKLKRESVLIHELTYSELEKCPEIKPIIMEFVNFIKDRPIVGHFLEIDLKFLKREIKNNLKIKFEPVAIDTYIIFNWLIERGLISHKFKGAKSLPQIAEAFDIKVETLHDALYDAFITAQIFQREIALIQSVQLSWFDFIKKIGRPNISGYMFGQYEKNYQF